MAGERQEVAALTITASGRRHYHPSPPPSSPPPSFLRPRQTARPSSVTQKAISVLPDSAACADRVREERRGGGREAGTEKRADGGIFLNALYIFIYLFWGHRLKFEGREGVGGGGSHSAALEVEVALASNLLADEAKRGLTAARSGFR